MCSLCELKTILHIYDEADPRWIIMDCMTCILPMAVWRADHKHYRKHTMDVSEKDVTDMENALNKVGEKKFGKGKFYIDKVQREVLDHLHWHARPNISTESYERWYGPREVWPSFDERTNDERKQIYDIKRKERVRNKNSE